MESEKSSYNLLTYYGKQDQTEKLTK